MPKKTRNIDTGDLDQDFESYVTRFRELFDDRPEGTFVKYGHTLIQRLGKDEFESRLENYRQLKVRCRTMLESGATISDAITLDFEEAASWLAVEAPNLLELFYGEMGDHDTESDNEEPLDLPLSEPAKRPRR